MKITHIEAIPVAVPRPGPHRSALGEFPLARAGIVRVRTDEGIEGWGEIVSLWHGEGAALCHDLNTWLGPALVGCDPTNLVALHARLDQLLQFGRHSRPLRAAVDMAAYDIWGKRLGVPVYRLLGGRARERIPLSMSVHMGPEAAMVRQAAEYVAAGFRTIKVKVGRDPDDDVRVVRLVRQAVGPAVGLRVDANMGWPHAKQALRTIRRLEEWDILSVEQPLPPEDLAGLHYLREHVEVPIIVDESVWTVSDAWRVIQAGAADLLNVYVAEAGGLWPALKLWTVAENAGVGLCIGSMPEFGFGTAAQAHLGVAATTLSHPSDVAGVLYQGDDLIVEPLRIEDGYAYPPEGPGLGVSPDWDRIQHYRIS